MASFSCRILQSNVTRDFPRFVCGFRRMARDRGLPSVGAIKYADDLDRANRQPQGRKAKKRVLRLEHAVRRSCIATTARSGRLHRSEMKPSVYLVAARSS